MIVLTVAEAVARATTLAGRGRVLLGIAGAPGAGKSTIAELVVAATGAVLVPMDGFHMPQADLVRLGRRERMGAPDTFDVDGYVALLRALRRGGVVSAPGFDRTIEEPVAGAIDVPAGQGLVVTEGNYLLHDELGWEGVAAELDEVWYVQLADGVRRQRLIERHIRFGKAPGAAEAWVDRSDESNARLVAGGKHRADVVVTGE